jgi:hypothetical protein
MVFVSMADAIRAGFQVCGNTPNGYRVRQRVLCGWQYADVFVTAVA